MASPTVSDFGDCLTAWCRAIQLSTNERQDRRTRWCEGFSLRRKKLDGSQADGRVGTAELELLVNRPARLNC